MSNVIPFVPRAPLPNPRPKRLVSPWGVPETWEIKRRGFMRWYLQGVCGRYNWELGPFRSRRGALKAKWW